MPYKSEPVPSKYVREAQFGEHSAVEPSKPHDGNHLDNEYDELAHCTSDIIDFILQTIDADGNIIDGHIPQLDDKVDVEGDTMTGSLVINEDLTVLGETDLNKLTAKNAEIDDVVAKTAVHTPVIYTDKVQMNEGINIHESAGVKWLSGEGHPEGRVKASSGSLYTQTDATDFASVLFMKEAGTGTTGWTEVTTSIHIGPNPPKNTYQLWYKTTGTGAGNTYLYYTDSDSSQWVPLSPSGGSGGEPGVGDLNNYVMRPYPKNANAWMVYNDYTRQWTAVTTDLITTNPDEIRAGFNLPDEEAELLVDQLRVNRYFLAKDEELRQEIIELEEEIDAIAPSQERGEWKFNMDGPDTPGDYSMNTEKLSEGLGDPASIFAAVENITLNEVDVNGTVHSFTDVEPGKLLEIFEHGTEDYGLFSVVAIEKTQGNVWSIDVDLVRSGTGHVASGVARFKIFTMPSGGDADSFLLKAGDNMEGQLDMKGEKGRNKIVNLAEPTQDYHAVNKKYVDDLANGGTLGGQCIDINGGKLCASSPVTSFINVIKNSIVWPKEDRYLETRPDKRPAYGDMANYYLAGFNLGEHYYYVDTSYNIRRKHEKWDTLETVWTRPTMSTGYAWERIFGLNDDHTFMCDSRHYYKYGSDNSQYMKVYFHSLDGSANDFNVSYGSHYGYRIETNSTAFTKDGMCFTTFIATNTANKQIHYIAVTDTSDKNTPKSDHVYTQNVTNLGGGSSGTTGDQFKPKHYVHRVGDELYLSSNESRDLWRFTGKAQNGQNIYGFYEEFEKIEKALPNLSTNDMGTRFIRYLPEVDRYYASCRNAGYLSRAGTGKRLTSETFVNSIKFAPSNWEYTHSFNGVDREYSRTRWASNNLPIVFNGEVVYNTNAMSESRDSVVYSTGPSYLVYNGGEVKQYDSDYYNKGEADFNMEQFWGFANRSTQPQNLPHYYEQTDVNTGETSLKSELQRYSQDKRYPNDQELTWNGVPVALSSATEGQQVTKVSATRPLRGKLLAKKSNDSGINGTSVWAMKSVDQLAGDYDNYNYLFLPNQWIMNYAGIPDGCEAGVNSMVGTWINTSKTVAVECFSTFGEPVTKTYSSKDYDGILIRLSHTFKGDFHFTYEIPDAVTITGELEEITQTVLTRASSIAAVDEEPTEAPSNE